MIQGLCETLEQLTMVGKVSRQQFKERFVQWTSEFDTYYIFVVEDTHKRKIVGVATLFVEKKLTHECGIYHFFFFFFFFFFNLNKTDVYVLSKGK